MAILNPTIDTTIIDKINEFRYETFALRALSYSVKEYFSNHASSVIVS